MGKTMAKRDRTAYQTKWRKERMWKLKLQFGGKCSRCGYDKCLDALDFHHTNPDEKSFNFRKGRGLAWDRLVEEANKCELVCANCHREIHSND